MIIPSELIDGETQENDARKYRNSTDRTLGSDRSRGGIPTNVVHLTSPDTYRESDDHADCIEEDVKEINAFGLRGYLQHQDYI
ncbi:hypothetical protein [Paenibacillus sacheonensis]|uniref:hypothetical protein n=1 Tax=Paenibacillus sacheonensis TaxID=742054 RepID=UPI001EF7A4DF|nr:hypothetical protein [Paenibacillus sacheonensis]MBM7565888.1 hypothetical protein [Paenibacillus sacheonensis]